jgi:RP/EB family microtubule-associated protein
VLEGDLKNRMEYNWKLIYALDDIIYQRDTLHKILQQIEESVSRCDDQHAKSMQRIIAEQPEDFVK